MIKVEKIYKILLFFIMLISFLGYEKHIFKYYNIIQIIVSTLLMLLIVVYFKIERNSRNEVLILMKKQYYLIILFSLMIINTLFGYAFYEYNSFLHIVSTCMFLVTCITLFFVIPSIIKKYESIEKYLLKLFLNISIFSAIISLAIQFNNGHFGPYNLIYGVRNASILYDPNFMAMIWGCALLLLLNLKFKSKIIKILCICLIGYAIFLTGSRGTLISCIIAIIMYLVLFKKINILKKTAICITLLICFLVLLNYLNSIDFFRTYQGSNDRFEMWKDIIPLTFESPIIGYGYGAIRETLNSLGYTILASTHNSFVDYVFSYGYLCAIIYIYIIMKILWNSLMTKDKKLEKYILLVIFMLINANTILYSFGGVGFSSLIYTIFLGILNINYAIKE